MNRKQKQKKDQNQSQEKKQNQARNRPANKHGIPVSFPTSLTNVETLADAHGAVRYGMTNDYMFRAVLESNPKVLRGLICALLHLSEEEVISVRIIKGTLLGKDIVGKEVRLDVYVSLNGSTIINLEMQISNKLNWDSRSVTYLCRSVDSLTRGQDYAEAKPVIHIGILDYTLFKGAPEFYASYKLLNVKNYRKYSDIITLNVLDLTHIDLATEEDKHYHIDEWAAFFKAATWEEVKMLAAKNEYLNEAAETLFLMNADEQIRKMCRDREEYYQDLRNYERAVAKRDDTIAEQRNTITEQRNTITEQENTITEQENTITEQENTITEQENTIADQALQIQQLLAENAKLKMQK